MSEEAEGSASEDAEVVGTPALDAEIAELQEQKVAAAMEEDYALAGELKAKIIALEAKRDALKAGSGGEEAVETGVAAGDSMTVKVTFPEEGSLGIKFGKAEDGVHLKVVGVTGGGQAVGSVLAGDVLVGVGEDGADQPLSEMKAYLGSGKRPALLSFVRANEASVVFTEEGSLGIKFGKNSAGDGLIVVSAGVGAQCEGKVLAGDVLLGISGETTSSLAEMKPFLKSSERPATCYFRRAAVSGVVVAASSSDGGGDGGGASAVSPPPPGRLSRADSPAASAPPPPSGGSSLPPGRKSKKVRRASMDGGADSGSGKMLKVEIAGEGSLGLEFGVDCNSGRVILVNVLDGGIVARSAPGVLESLDRLDMIASTSLRVSQEEAAAYKAKHGNASDEANDAAAQKLLDKTISIIVDTPRPFTLIFHRPEARVDIPPPSGGGGKAGTAASKTGGASGGSSGEARAHNPIRYFRGKGFMYYQAGGLIKKWGPGYINFNSKANVLNYWKSSSYPGESPSFMLNLEGGTVGEAAGEPRAFTLTATDGKVHKFSAMDHPMAEEWVKLLKAAIHCDISSELAHDILHGSVGEEHPVWHEPEDMAEEFIDNTRMKYTQDDAKARAHDDSCAAARRKPGSAVEESQPLLTGGWLYKRGQQNTAWKLRFADLQTTPECKLNYFEKHTDSKAKGSIDMKAAKLVEVGPTADTLCGRSHSLVIKDGAGKLIKLCTASAGEALIWFDALQRVMVMAHSARSDAASLM